MLIAVVGQGYVGLPEAVAIASAGHTVYAAESDPTRHASLTRCHSYIAEVDSVDLRRLTEAGRYRPVLDASQAPSCHVYLIATPTTLTSRHTPDLSHIDAALAAIARSARPGALIVLESTTYPGALRHHVAPLFEKLSGLRAGADVHFAYSPERLDPGRGTVLEEVPKLVSGLDKRSGQLARDFYETVFQHVVEVSGAEIAEFAKLLENTFRYVNIAYVNELSKTAKAMNIPFREVVAAAASKPFGFMPFHHGPGVGGHCLPSNVHYLNYALAAAGAPSELLTVAERINSSMPDYTVERLRRILSRTGTPLRGARILVLGLAFKADVADARNAPTHAISDSLVRAGAAVRVADPWVARQQRTDSFELVELTAEECTSADAILLVTDHRDVDYDLVLNSGTVILDCRGHLSAQEVEQL
ncbi:nucleotide sugar dehydrogenase [Streptomyces sp. NPDC057743]|uniref:nucleotide sugar dehydrogenase n=1 Tax=Streptomyces sp. NPDC057743 TaxID=3346236 RepID=UPI0036A9692F